MLVVGQSDNPGGVEAVIKRYYEVIKQTVQIDLMVSSKTCYDEEYYRNHGCHIFFVKSAQFREPLKYKKEIKAFFEKNRNVYDAIWFNCCDLANCGYIMKQAKVVGIKKRIIHGHNNQLMQTGTRRYLYVGMHQYWKYNVDRYATDFWACSYEAGEFFYKKSIVKSNKFKVINNAIEVERYSRNNIIRQKIREQLNIRKDCIVLGHVGRFQYQKNHEFLIPVYNEFYQKHPNSKLVLIGQGEEEENVKKQVELLNLNEQVLFLGARDDVNEMLQAMDVFVLPSLFEGLGIVLIEAQAAGLPCVATKDTIPESVNVTGNVKFVGLDKPVTEWAEAIDEQLSKKINYLIVKKQIVDAGYDIATEGQKFRQFIEG